MWQCKVRNIVMFLENLRSNFLIFSCAFFLSVAVFCDTSLAQQEYEVYDTQGYTQEEISRLDTYCEVIGLAYACDFDIRDGLTSVLNWLRDKEENGYPDLGMYFYDKSGFVAVEQMNRPTIPCYKVRQMYQATEFPK
jgi:hypothetical protein